MNEANGRPGDVGRYGNNFDFLRLAAAALVIFSHSYPLATGSEMDEPLKALTGGAMTLGHLGVAVFFIISGYLITKSWINRPRASSFFWNRVLRLVPGLLCVSLFTIFIVGPLSTSLSLAGYFTDLSTWKYLLVACSFGWLGNHLPAVFATNPLPGAVNGSLWTLLPEFKMYVIVFALGALGLLRKNTLVCGAGLLGILVLFRDYLTGTIIGPLYKVLSFVGLYIDNGQIEIAMLLPLLFLCGSLYYVITRNSKKFEYRLPVALLLLVLWVLSFRTGFFLAASVVCLPYITLCIAFARIPLVNMAGAHGDFSYGMYIYAFPVQQLIVHYCKGLSVPEMFVASMLLTLPVSVLSWTFVESRALRLKGIDPVEIIKSKSRNFTCRWT